MVSGVSASDAAQHVNRLINVAPFPDPLVIVIVRFTFSDAFLKRIYAQTPWRTWPPTVEFYNIDRLELLDNEYSNTMIVIHPSVKTVVFRGDISKVQVQSPNTQVIRLAPNQDPDTVIPPDPGALAGLPPMPIDEEPALPEPAAAPGSPAAIPQRRETNTATVSDSPPSATPVRPAATIPDFDTNPLALARVATTTNR